MGEGNRVGQQLGNYQLVRLLGAGGFAEVYLGEHVHLGTLAAVKVLHTRLAGEDITNFRNEARTIAQLEHPHIVRVLDFGIENTVPFLVMSYAPNGSLRQRYPRRTRLPLETILTYVRQVADALQYAHDERFIHRDIKPENMLLGKRHELLLSDFGIALVAQSTRMQSVQEVIGTVAYMAPEMLHGHPKPASDQYALGIVIYEWLCGDLPFRGGFTELASQHMFAQPPSLREKNPEIAAEIERVVMTTLAKEPAQRFASVRAFARAFEQACAAAAAASPPSERESLPPPPTVRPLEGARPSRLQDQMASSIAPAPSPRPPVQLTTPSQPIPSPVVPTQYGQSVNTPVEPTQLAQSINTPVEPTQYGQPSSVPVERTQQAVHSQPSKQVISRRAALIGLGIAGVAVVGGGITWFAVSHSQQSTTNSPTQPPTNSPTQLPGTIGTTLYTYKGHSSWVLSVAWSPDGKRIASASRDGTVQVWNAADGSNAFTYQGHSSPVGSVAWSPDGKRIASGSIDKTVQVWTAV